MCPVAFRWMSSTKATYPLQQVNKTNNGWLSCVVPYLELNSKKISQPPLSTVIFFTPSSPKKQCLLHNVERVIIYYLQKLLMTPPLDSHNTTEPNPEMLSAVSTRNRICHHGKIYVTLCVHTSAENTSFLVKDD